MGVGDLGPVFAGIGEIVSGIASVEEWQVVRIFFINDFRRVAGVVSPTAPETDVVGAIVALEDVCPCAGGAGVSAKIRNAAHVRMAGL